MDANGDFQGDFRGPLAKLLLDAGPPVLTVGGKTTSGSPGDFVVNVSAVTGPTDEPTVTITFDGVTLPFDFDTAQSATYGTGELSETFVIRTIGQERHIADQLAFQGLDTEYAALLLLTRYALDSNDDPTTPLLTGFATVGADVVSMPTTGSATFDTGVTGILGTFAGDGGFFIGRTDVSVDFGTGSVTGTWVDVDWDPGPSGGPLVEASPCFPADPSCTNHDFGLTLNATVSGDDFSGTMSTSGAHSTISLTGFVEGDFYGPLNASPEEIGGAFGMDGVDGIAFGGFIGKLK